MRALSNHTQPIRTDNVNEGCFPRVLKTDQSKFHLFFPKETFEPVEDAIEEGKHDGWKSRGRQ